MIYGNIDGLKKSLLERLEDLRGLVMENNELLDENTAYELWEISTLINREVIIITDKRNEILEVGVGDFRSASFPEIDYEKIQGAKSFHTHPNENPNLSDQDKSAMLSLGLDLLGAVVVRDDKILVGIGVLDVEDDEIVVKVPGIFSLKDLRRFEIDVYSDKVSKFKRNAPKIVSDETEKAVLIGVSLKSKTEMLDIQSSMDELKELALTAEVVPVDMVVQNKDKIDSNFYIGKGKLLELKELIQIKNANIVICNDELNAVQLRIIETVLGVKVIDRTALILDIFAKHATTGEGKLQVELAQLKYRLPRLMGMGKVLSRAGGGIGTRGPGEKKLETDRRAIYKQVNILEKRIKDMQSARQIQKSRRVKNQIPVVSLVGYTNAGKSTMFNLISSSSVLAQDKLFATLDSTTRKIKMDDKEFLLSDTVGFIEKLPHDLVESFKSTLDEVKDADLILHIIDSSNPNCLQQIKIVEEVLQSIECSDKEMVYVFNKTDIVGEDFDQIYSMIRGDKLKTSAITGDGVEKLLKAIVKKIFGDTIEKVLEIPYSDSKYVSYLHSLGVVTDEKYLEDKIVVKVQISEKNEHLLNKGKV
ncbi:GTPase HflX [Alkalibacter saccharofermentans]|uniref:GTPase HflX n=1 Tax=Alkalibacter saccharofermentans DSM 14828 TaxID=1120975 RepID=A0A1M4S4E0_9FIRM|nr:GTPase HflX [Alkalibacter saccharofermentans]SHE27000.1 GTP-binding protein HflX [Alkalibacter saccharofermentans DSM 14828]